MKLKYLLLISYLSLATTALANPYHLYPQCNSEKNSHYAVKNFPDVKYCQIEIINNSPEDIWVYGRFDDDSSLIPFYIYSFDRPHYISLLYNDFCHEQMHLTLKIARGYPVFAGNTQSNSIVTILPYRKNQVSVHIS